MARWPDHRYAFEVLLVFLIMLGLNQNCILGRLCNIFRDMCCECIVRFIFVMWISFVDVIERQTHNVGVVPLSFKICVDAHYVKRAVLRITSARC